MARPLDADGAVLDALARRGGAARPSDLSSVAGLSRATVARRLDRLVSSGRLERAGRGLYRDPAVSVHPLLSTLRQLGAGHLTGLDALPGAPQQFMLDAPHLVRVEPVAQNAVAAALTDADYTVVSPRDSRQVRLPRLNSLVVLRPESPILSRRRGVIAQQALPEKAWFDLAREVADGTFPMSAYEVGRLLFSLIDQGSIDPQRLRRLLTQGKWLKRLGPALGNEYPAHDRFTADLQAGARGELR